MSFFVIVELFLIVFIVYILYKNVMMKKINYISEYDVVDEDNFITNDPYFEKGVWSGGSMGPDAPTGPAMGSTPMRNYSSKSYLGVSSFEKLCIDNPLI